MKIFENYILTNDHLERIVRQPYTAGPEWARQRT